MINALDYLGIIIFITIAIVIYKKYWFYSYYSFIKFVIFSIASLIMGLGIASQNAYDSNLSNLQIALIVQQVIFFVLWKVVSFRKIFFTIDRHTLNIDRFVYLHRINIFINIFPSLIASFFVSFFLFTLLLSFSVNNLFLQDQIQNSKIVKDIPYRIYFAPIAFKDLRLFENVAFKIIPTIEFKAGQSIEKLKKSLAGKELEKINNEREKVGLKPIGVLPYVPPEDEIVPDNPSSPPPSQDRVFIPPISEPNPTGVQIPTPTNTPISTTVPQPTNPNNPLPTPTSVQTPPNTPTFTPIPTQTPEPNPSTLRAIEQEIFNLTNQKRAENGLSPYTWSEEIASVARAHSQDMSDRAYFSHYSPDGVDPFQRLQLGGVSFSTAGENIAAGPSADIMIRNWMNSSGHRANILSARFGKIGVGVASNGRYGYLATQDFTN